MTEINEYANGIRVSAATSLEQYRFQSFHDKEPETVEWMDTVVSNGDTVIDIGANIGVYSLYLAKTKPKSKIIAIEPFLENFSALSTNIRLNDFQNVVPLSLAISNHDHIATFFIKDDRIGASGSQINSNIDETGEKYEELYKNYVLTFSLDSLIEKFQISEPNHIKIDVDGFERKIIEGMDKTLANTNLRSILIEVNSNGPDRDFITSKIKSAGFNLDNKINVLENHSRVRRSKKSSNVAENIVFTRP